METDTRDVGFLKMPVMSRFDRLDRMLDYLEKKQMSCSSESCPLQHPAQGEPDKQCKPLASAVEEVGFKGTMMERLAILENRVLQLSLEMEEENASSNSISTLDIESIRSLPPEEHDGKILNNLDKQDKTIIQKKGFQETQICGSYCQNKSARRKKTPWINQDSRRFGWFHMGC